MSLQCESVQEDRITKLSQILPRPDGSEVKIVVTEMFGAGLQRSVDSYVLRRETPEHPWSLCSDARPANWKTMSRADYMEHGRSEKLKAVSHGEVLKLIQLLGQPMSVLH
jgi:hypothetical protein